MSATFHSIVTSKGSTKSVTSIVHIAPLEELFLLVEEAHTGEMKQTNKQKSASIPCSEQLHCLMGNNRSYSTLTGQNSRFKVEEIMTSSAAGGPSKDHVGDRNA